MSLSFDSLSEDYARQRLSESPLASLSLSPLLNPLTSSTSLPHELADSFPPERLKYIQASLWELFFYFKLNYPEITLYDICAKVSEEVGFLKVLGYNYMKDLITVDMLRRDAGEDLCL